jgi:hypothetical protein
MRRENSDVKSPLLTAINDPSLIAAFKRLTLELEGCFGRVSLSIHWVTTSTRSALTAASVAGAVLSPVPRTFSVWAPFGRVGVAFVNTLSVRFGAYRSTSVSAPPSTEYAAMLFPLFFEA